MSTSRVFAALTLVLLLVAVGLFASGHPAGIIPLGLAVLAGIGWGVTAALQKRQH